MQRLTLFLKNTRQMAEIMNTSLTYAFKNVPDGQDLCSSLNWSFPVTLRLSIIKIGIEFLLLLFF